MKSELTIIEKIGVVADVISSCTDSDGGLDYLAFELSKVFHIGRAYYGEALDVEDDGVISLVLTYENFVQSKVWKDLVSKNEDAQLLLNLVERKYSEEFQKATSLENKIIKMIQELISKIPTKEEFSEIAKDNVDFLENLTEEQREILGAVIKK
jgi:hypothetical protein